MREYGQIQCSFWSDPDIQGMSNDTKLMALYLLSGPHSNGIGCYRLPDGYIQADMEVDQETISKGFDELSSIGFAYRCTETNFVFIPKFLKWNGIANINVAAAREKEFKTIPKKHKNYKDLCKSILKYGKHLSEGFETVLKLYGKQDPTPPHPTQTKTGEDNNGESRKDDLSAFNEFWDVFADKRGKDGALRVWKRRRLGLIADEVIIGAERYAKSRGADRKYWKQAQGWLNDGRWQDEIPANERDSEAEQRFNEWLNGCGDQDAIEGECNHE